MKRYRFLIPTLCLLAVPVLFACTPTDNPEPEVEDPNGYYFDSTAEDGGDGSMSSPFNDLSVAEELELSAGKTLYLKRGSLFEGAFTLDSVSGTAQAPVTVTAYGTGEQLPAIDGNDVSGAGVLLLRNCSYITVDNLELFDSATTEGDRRGVLVTVDNPDGKEMTVYSGITLHNLYIHDIRGFTDAENSGMAIASKRTGGIHVWSEEGTGRTDGLTISGCRITNVDNVGIATWCKMKGTQATMVSPYSDKFENSAHSNLRICDNEVSYIGKNAIFARNLMGGVIERNTVFETALRCVSGNTIVTSRVNGTVVQYNEGYLNRAKPRPSDGVVQDGCMLDADLESRDTVWQYNYSHDNSFGLFLNCTSYEPENGVLDHATVRYNLSVNDYGNKGIIYVNYKADMIDIYNNTFVIPADVSPVILQNNSGRNFRFFNNVIYNLSAGAKFTLLNVNSTQIFDNLVYNDISAGIAGMENFRSLNQNGIYADPWFTGNIGATLEARTGRGAADAFRLLDSSPALSVGTQTAAVADFFGNPYKRSIGFYCG